MFLDEDIIDFFEKHHIAPGEFTIGLAEYLRITFDAASKSEIFRGFVKDSLVPIAHNKYRVVFESWEDLINCYYSFMTGFSGIKC
jgi:hypothetical protein